MSKQTQAKSCLFVYRTFCNIIKCQPKPNHYENYCSAFFLLLFLFNKHFPKSTATIALLFVPVQDIQLDAAIAVLLSIKQPVSSTTLASSEQASEWSDSTESNRKSTCKFLNPGLTRTNGLIMTKTKKNTPFNVKETKLTRLFIQSLSQKDLIIRKKPLKDSICMNSQQITDKILQKNHTKIKV